MDNKNTVQNSFEIKQCWVCFKTMDNNENDEVWLAPCRCHGSTQWVHQKCVQLWISENLKDYNTLHATCLLCQKEYFLIYKKHNFLVNILNRIEYISNFTGPFVVTGFLITAIYWSGVCYGAITMTQVMGKQAALKMMEGSNPFLLIFLFPLIPYSLIVIKLTNWKDCCISLIQRLTIQRPSLKNYMPSFLYEPIEEPYSFVHFSIFSNALAGLLFPSIATVIGKVLFKNTSNIRRTFLGGLIYIAVKSAARFYQGRHNNFYRKTRIIMDYETVDEKTTDK